MSAAVILVRSVQTGQARARLIGGRSVMTAIDKQAHSGPVAVGPLGLVGDEQADPSVHGGLDKAVYAYPSEHYAFWQQARAEAGIDAPLAWGALGENLSLDGLLESELWIGDVLQLPHCRLRVVEPRVPCFKFNAAMGFNQAAKRMAHSGFCGFYLRVDGPGQVQAGDLAELQPGARELKLSERFQRVMFKAMP